MYRLQGLAGRNTEAKAEKAVDGVKVAKAVDGGIKYTCHIMVLQILSPP